MTVTQPFGAYRLLNDKMNEFTQSVKQKKIQDDFLFIEVSLSPMNS